MSDTSTTTPPPPTPRPCPFCGSTNLTLPDMLAGVFDDTFVTCQDCDAIGPSTPSKATAIEMWNDRAGEAAITKRAVGLLSGGCDKHVDLSFDAFVEAGGGGCPICLQAQRDELRAMLVRGREQVEEYQGETKLLSLTFLLEEIDELLEATKGDR